MISIGTKLDYYIGDICIELDRSQLFWGKNILKDISDIWYVNFRPMRDLIQTVAHLDLENIK